jgi:hypothetical protein
LLFNGFSGFFSRFFYLTMVLFECASLTLFTSILIRFYLFVWYLESFLIELKQNCLICFTESLSFSLHNHQCYQSGLHVLSTESWADFASIHKFPFSNYLYFEFVLLFFFSYYCTLFEPTSEKCVVIILYLDRTVMTRFNLSEFVLKLIISFYRGVGSMRKRVCHII